MTAPMESSGTPVADRDRVAVILHDADCRDRCEPSAMGIYYKQADALFDAGLLVGPCCHRSEVERPVLDREALRKILAKAYAAGMNRYNSGKINPPSEVQKLDEFTDAVMKMARSEAEVKAEALREAADLGYYNSAWLRERADELEEGR